MHPWEAWGTFESQVSKHYIINNYSQPWPSPEISNCYPWCLVIHLVFWTWMLDNAIPSWWRDERVLPLPCHHGLPGLPSTSVAHFITILREISPFSWPGNWEEGRVWWCPEMERSGWWQTRPTLPTTGPWEGGEEESRSDENIPQT